MMVKFVRRALDTLVLLFLVSCVITLSQRVDGNTDWKRIYDILYWVFITVVGIRFADLLDWWSARPKTPPLLHASGHHYGMPGPPPPMPQIRAALISMRLAKERCDTAVTTWNRTDLELQIKAIHFYLGLAKNALGREQK